MGSQCPHRQQQQQNPKIWRRWPLQTTNDASAALQTLPRSRSLKTNNLLRTRTKRWLESGAVTRTVSTSAPSGFPSPGFALSLSLARTLLQLSLALMGRTSNMLSTTVIFHLYSTFNPTILVFPLYLISNTNIVAGVDIVIESPIHIFIWKLKEEKQG